MLLIHQTLQTASYTGRWPLACPLSTTYTSLHFQKALANLLHQGTRFHCLVQHLDLHVMQSIVSGDYCFVFGYYHMTTHAVYLSVSTVLD